jgi:hypothetical protein
LSGDDLPFEETASRLEQSSWKSSSLISILVQPPLCKKQLGVFLQIFDILQKKGEINLKIGGI